MNNATHKDVDMKRILKWHKVGQINTACLYITVLPFLVLFIMHTTNPAFEWCHLSMRALLITATLIFAGRIFNALMIKYRISQWERENHKLTNKEIIQLL